MEKRPQRSGGRSSRQKLRASKGKTPNPAPPGQKGGQYRPLSDADIDQIITAALNLLDTLGMGEVPPRLAELFLSKGAERRDDGRITFPLSLTEDTIALAARKFVLHGRDPDRSIEVGGDSVHFGTGGAAVQTLDLETGTYRPSTLQDLYDFTRLQDQLQNVSWFTRCCVATDIPDNFDLDVNTVYALLCGTTKPVATSFTLAEHVAPIVAMLDIAEGGDGRFSARPFVKAHISPVISPMRFGEDAVDVTYACIEHNIPLSCITAAQAGATAPATLAGFLVQSLAETLASLLMVNLIRPGYPMVFSNWPLVIDLRTGAFSGGGGETALLNAASAQLSNALGLPSGVASSMTDAKAIDAQYGAEKGITALAAGLAGGNLIYESSGMTAALLGASFEAFLLDNDMHSAIYRTLRGIEVNDDTIALEHIEHAILGDGHFLGQDQTIAAMERDYVYPVLANRDPPVTWDETGRMTIWQNANQRAREILAQYHPEYLDTKCATKIKEKFKIYL
ncbi:trimethylamine methyltransferase family protein [Alphaproteobacteria bacterium LSUCC0684]